MGFWLTRSEFFPISSLTAKQKKLVTLDQEATWLPRDKHKRLHLFLLEQTMGTWCIVKRATGWSEEMAINTSRRLTLEALEAGNHLKLFWSHFEES